MYKLNETLLKLQDINLSFGDNLILRDINYEVKDITRDNNITGQVITLLGKSGVGKTQLMKIIAGLQAPTQGRVLLGKHQVDVQPGLVGMVMQSYPLFNHRTLLGNLELVSDDKEKIMYYCNEFDIVDHLNKYPSQLSGGQRQRTAIVQQLLCSDKFILLDEPFSGLDPVATEKLTQNILKVANQDDENTVIISSHILEPSLEISDTVLMLGHDYLVDGDKREKVKGATIKHMFDLASHGLAWTPNIRTNPLFRELIEDIRKIFKTM